MQKTRSYSKVGVYVDVSNMYLNGGRRMQYDVLRGFAGRDNAELVRLNAYVSFDAERAERDSSYFEGVSNFYSVLRDLGYKVVTKEVKWYEDETGKRYGKANADLDLAVDVLLQSENLDRVLLATGDGDFTRVVRALQNRGCRVEIVAVDNISSELRNEADMFMSAYLIPKLIPARDNGKLEWGKPGSYVRGICYYHNEQGYGFFRYLRTVAPGLWLTDTRRPDSPYEAVFFHDSDLPDDFDASIFPSRHHVMEFKLVESQQQDGYQATDIRLVSRLPGW